MVVVRQALVILVAGTLGYSGAAWGQALAGDPPGRVGRLAFTEGTVSFHDADRTDWGPATINQPLTSGDAVWTEPNAHSEISIAGTRVRMDGATQLDMVNIDDQQTRLQLDQGRVDIKTLTFDARQPYELVTPRGVATLEQKGDYYVEAGSTQDPTRLGVRQGAAQFQAPDGRVLAVRAGEVAEMTGDGSSMELHTIQTAPPPMPQYWAARDRVVVYDQPPQYLSAGITGYEDLNYYGSWSNDPEYGQVWYVRDAPAGWAPYTTGRWISDPVYGWTWVDEQPWGFAPYHYGRWAHRGERWFWVPPERSQPAVYAPALVAFVGGLELGQALSAQNRQPVGWFPLGPREVYVPPYTADRDYYRRVNLAARVENRILEDRWERAQRREAIAEQNWANRRFATVVPAEAFARSQPVQRAALRVDAQKLAAVPVAAVAVPPSPTVSVRAIQAPAALTATAPTQTQPSTGTPTARTTTALQAQPVMQQAIKAEPQAQKAPGPQIATRAAAPTAPDQKPALPKLEPRNASAPPLPQIQGERKPATTQPGPQQVTAPTNQPAATTPKPGEPAKPGEPQANAPANRPGVPPLPGEQNRTQPGQQPGQANLPPVRDRNDQRAEPPRPGQPPQATTQPNAATPNAQPPKPGEPPKSPQATTTAPQPPKLGEPPKSPQATTTAPQPPKPGEPPKSPQATTTAPQPPKPGEPPKSPQVTNTPAPPHQAEPPKPQAVPQPQHQATPPSPPPPQQQLQRAPAPSAPPPPAQTHAAPPPQPQASPPQQHAAPAAPPPQVHAPAPPPPQQAQAPHPAPPPQAPPPQQAQAPHPAPPPQAPPPQQAQAPHPAPAPQQAPHPAPAPQQKKPGEN